MSARERTAAEIERLARIAHAIGAGNSDWLGVDPTNQQYWRDLVTAILAAAETDTAPAIVAAEMQAVVDEHVVMSGGLMMIQSDRLRQWIARLTGTDR